MVKGAIFDLDGTLLDSMHIWEDIDDAFLKECGVDIPNNINEVLKAMTVEECMEFFINELGVKLSKKEISKRIVELMREVYLFNIEAKPFVRQVLEKFKKQNIKMCVATANDYDLTHETLKRLNLMQYFDFIVTCSQLGCSKTQPHIYNYCADKLGFMNKEILVFEDALHCVETAKKAGFIVIGVYDKYSENDAQKIKKLSDQYIYSFGEELRL